MCLQLHTLHNPCSLKDNEVAIAIMNDSGTVQSLFRSVTRLSAVANQQPADSSAHTAIQLDDDDKKNNHSIA